MNAFGFHVVEVFRNDMFLLKNGLIVGCAKAGAVYRKLVSPKKTAVVCQE
jgi:hypothetical protein